MLLTSGSLSIPGGLLLKTLDHLHADKQRDSVFRPVVVAKMIGDLLIHLGHRVVAVDP